MIQDSWAELADELERLKATERLEAQWYAYVGSEDYGIWILRPEGPRTEQARATFGLIAARAIEKLGIAPIPVPKPLQHCPHWTESCSAEEEFVRQSGRTMDLSDAVPYGLDKVDWDAVDPCTRAWLELLRVESRAFRIYANGNEVVRGQNIRRWVEPSMIFAERLQRTANVAPEMALELGCMRKSPIRLLRPIHL